MVNIQCETWETVQEIQCPELLEEYRVTESSDPHWALNRGIRGRKKICLLGAFCLGMTSPVCSLNNLSWKGCLELIWSCCLLRAGVAVSELPVLLNALSQHTSVSPGVDSPVILNFASCSVCLLHSPPSSLTISLFISVAVLKHVFSLNSDPCTELQGLYEEVICYWFNWCCSCALIFLFNLLN